MLTWQTCCRCFCFSFNFCFYFAFAILFCSSILEYWNLWKERCRFGVQFAFRFRFSVFGCGFAHSLAFFRYFLLFFWLGKTHGNKMVIKRFVDCCCCCCCFCSVVIIVVVLEFEFWRVLVPQNGWWFETRLDCADSNPNPSSKPNSSSNSSSKLESQGPRSSGNATRVGGDLGNVFGE